MSEEFDTPYAKLTHFVKLGREDSIVFRADTLDILLRDEKEAAELSKELIDAGATLKAAFEVVKAAVEAEKPARAAPARGSAARGGARTPSARPGSSVRPKREEKFSDEVCDCGEPYKDLDGKRYVKGDKEGELYPWRYYSSCDNRACKPFGLHS